MSSKILSIKKKANIGTAKINLPASKSVANRALIINALAGGAAEIKNISDARDTQTMQRLLHSDEVILDVLDAGTTMRFLAAYLSVTNQQKVLTGTPRMCQRPIKILGDALKELGGSIDYEQEEGYPPVRTSGFTQTTNEIAIRGDVSSQYISALLMIAPVLPEGLTLTLTGRIGSRPYIAMTLKLMERFGISYNWNDNVISISHQDYIPTSYTVEPDWSGASYWYAFVALSTNAELMLNNLQDQSLQGDRAIADMMENLGVKTLFDDKGAQLSKTNHLSEVSLDFTDCPDLAQTVAVVCAAKGITCYMTGLESLKIKETDRIKALQDELAKFGARLEEKSSEWTLIPGDITDQKLHFDTYDDHRMAMALAPLSTLIDIEIENPDVVNKSYPTFWKNVAACGFNISTLTS